jgi:hypothetical protein
VPSPRRVALALVATAIIAAPIFGAVSSASAAPTAPVITSPTTGLETSNSTVDLTGTADSGSTVTVFADGTAIPSCTDIAVVDATPDPVWECLGVPLDIGTTSFRAQATSAGQAGPKSASVKVTQFGTNPASIDGPTDSTTRYPTFYGTGAELGTVTVGMAPETFLCSANVATDGSWSCKSTEKIPFGWSTIGATGYWRDGTEDEASASLSIFVTPAPPKVTMSLSPAIIGFSVVGNSESFVVGEFYSVFYGEGEGAIGYTPIDECPAAESYVLGSVSCSFGGLAPDIYNVYSYQHYVDGAAEDDYESTWVDDYVIIPEKPTLAAPVPALGTTKFSGTGTPGYRAIVRSSSGDTLCKAISSANGNWSCSANLGGGDHAVRVTQQARGFDISDYFDVDPEEVHKSYNGLSAYTAMRSFTVPYPAVIASAPTSTPEPTDTPSPEPTPSVTPPAFVWTFAINGDDDGVLNEGEKLTITGDGPPGSSVSAELHSTPIPLGQTVVNSGGTFSLPVVIPAGVDPGSHNIVVTITPPDTAPATAEAPVTIAGADDGTATDDAAIRAARNVPGAPALFTDSVKTVAEVISSPLAIAGAAGAGIALLLFVALPAELLNVTFEENYERMFGRLSFLKRRREPLLARITAWFARFKLLGGIGLTLFAALVFGFADPNFGFDVASLRTVLASGIALFIVGYVASALTGLILRGRWAMVTTIELKPLGIVLTILGVVLSRLLDFSPGFLFGLIIGLGVIGASSLAERVRLTLVNSGLIFAFSIAAWLGYSAIAGAGGTTGFWDTLGNDTMVAVTSEGLTALVVGLLPLRFLEGESLFQRSKLLWAGAYLLAAIAFVLILIPAADNWGETTGPVWFWIGALVVFGIAAFAVYMYFRLTHIDEEEHEQEREHELV